MFWQGQLPGNGIMCSPALSSLARLAGCGHSRQEAPRNWSAAACLQEDLQHSSTSKLFLACLIPNTKTMEPKARGKLGSHQRPPELVEVNKCFCRVLWWDKELATGMVIITREAFHTSSHPLSHSSNQELAWTRSGTRHRSPLHCQEVASCGIKLSLKHQAAPSLITMMNEHKEGSNPSI